MEKRQISSAARLWLLLAAGFILRLIFMGNEGFKNDVASFEAWSLTLLAHPFSQFYSSTSFADYPPGYFYILWIVGHLYALIAPHGNYTIFKYLVKLPAVLMDLVDGALLYAVVRRFASERAAFGVAALFVLNPAVIFVSAAWGQVDSISAGLALLALYLLLRSDDRGASQIVLAWISIAYSLLIKPQAAILIPLFVVFALVSPERRRTRLIGTGAGILGALLLALVLTLPFHPTANPLNAFAWLYERYNYGKNVYAFNSVNAFNLWSAWKPFWQPDSQKIFGLWPQYIWGILLVAAASVLTLVRYVQVRTQGALLESAALLALAFFLFATRMHERYIFDALLLTMACIPLAARYLWASIAYSVTLLVNLFYSLMYLNVVTSQTPGVNATDMWPAITHPLSILNVGLFFYLGYVFLGSSEQDAAHAPEPATATAETAPGIIGKPRSWFDPREGLAAMRWPLDYALASFFGVLSFIVSYVNYWLPNEKVFDEIYFARAAEEYLTHKYIYENTHPPLTKLIITLSTMLFGGMAHGDNPHGWRFLDVVFGAIAVAILYAFARRVTRSSLFASLAALMFIADGMHFVQSRIATPEGIVIVFSLGALYAFYRFWIASQSTVRPYECDTLRRVAISAGGGLVLGFASGALAAYLAPLPHSVASYVVAGCYFSVGWYLAIRLLLRRLLGTRGELITYPEGSRVLREGQKYTRMDARASGSGGLYGRDGTIRYETPAGSATYAPGRVTDDLGETQEGRHATGWLIAFTVLLGALVASKWYGVMAYGVSFVVIGVVWLQRYWREGKSKQWGNPFGFRLDVSIATIVFLSMSVYVAVWIPDFVRHIEIKNLTDLVYRQYTMFEYHDTLKATHPYQSVFWQWPIDQRPIAYYWKDLRPRALALSPTACCVREIISLPNPLILWFGLLCVPLVALLAWWEKNKGYALLVLAYLLQWLPWALSPRITFAYHFYVDIPIVILCNVIVLQRVWNARHEARSVFRAGVLAYTAAVVLAFIWFYPILAAVPIPWNQWYARMWLGSHWI